jgi:ATP-dependent Zn protease
MDKKLVRTAYHEAGHAIASHMMGGGTRRVTIKPNAHSLGCHTGRLFWTKSEQLAKECSDRHEFGATKALRKCTNQSMIKLAGMYAEKKYTGRFNRVGASADLDAHHDLIDRLLPDDKERQFFDRWVCRRTEMFVENNWRRIEVIAQALCERTTLKGDEIRDVLSAAVHAAPAKSPQS